MPPPRPNGLHSIKWKRPSLTKFELSLQDHTSEVLNFICMHNNHMSITYVQLLKEEVSLVNSLGAVLTLMETFVLRPFQQGAIMIGNHPQLTRDANAFPLTLQYSHYNVTCTISPEPTHLYLMSYNTPHSNILPSYSHRLNYLPMLQSISECQCNEWKWVRPIWPKKIGCQRMLILGPNWKMKVRSSGPICQPILEIWWRSVWYILR